MTYRFHKILSSLLFLSIISNTDAQTKYNYELINQKSLANFGAVHSLYQDTTGIIWLGHFGKGLQYYDGERIQRLHLEDEGSFADKSEVFVEADGFLYLNFGNEIKIFDPIDQSLIDSIQIKNAPEQNGEINFIAVNRENKDVYGLYELENISQNDSTTHFHILLSSNNKPFTQITETPIETRGRPLIKILHEDIIVKNEKEFLRINKSGKILRAFPLPNFDLLEINQRNCTVDKLGRIWFGEGWQSRDKGIDKSFALYHLNTKTGELNFTESFNINKYTVASRYKRLYLNSLFFVNEDLFINGFIRYNLSDGSYEHLGRKASTSEKWNFGHKSGSIFSAIEDHTGVIFMGSSMGFGKMSPKPDAFKEIPFITVRGFVEDEEGFIYGGNYESVYGSTGINVYDPKKDEVTSLSSHVHWYSAVYLDKKIYFSNSVYNKETGKLEVFDPSIKSFTSFNYGTISNLLVGKDKLWKTSWKINEIFIYDIRTRELIQTINIPQLNNLAIDMNDMYVRRSDNTVWLGTYGQGVFIFSENGELLQHINSGDQGKVILNNSIVSSFYEDGDRNMWVGHGSGISKINAALTKIEHFTIDEENPDYYLIYGILPEDDDRYLWLSSNEGIFRFDTESGVFMDFPLNPDVMNMEYNRTSYYKAKDGRMYFGGSDNFGKNFAFYPGEVVEFYENVELGKAKIILNNFSKYDSEKEKLISYKNGLQKINEITLNPGDRYFSIEYLLSDYRSPENNYFSYYLDGYEKEWSQPAKNNNKIRFENLPPGKYTLKMRGALMRNNLHLNERHIIINVIPYWYQTWWSKVAFGLLTSAGFYFFYKIKMTRQLEKQEALRLQDLDNLKTRLYTNITHEFRTPLTVILGMNDNIRGHVQEKNLIKRNAKNLLRLVNQLLDLSKLDSGTMKMDAVKGDIVGYLQYLTESFYSMASDKKVNLSFKPFIISLIMDFDEVKIQHIIYNLLSNAIKFTRPGGKVGLETSLSSMGGKEHLKIKVKDTGVGIPEKDLPHIFDRFYQTDYPNGLVARRGDLVKNFAGTGIGLALTKELVELMGGTISVKSEKDWGSEFIIFLPVKQDLFTPKIESDFEANYSENELLPDMEVLPVKPDHVNSDRPQVLVVEDNAGVVTYVKSILKEEYFVQVAINGQEGINMALEHIPDLILTDVMMPEKNGFEVCETLKSDERTSHIPIVMLTAKADIDSKIEGLKTGADAYLSKPFEKAELLVRLKKLLELRKKLQAYYANSNLNGDVEERASKIENAFIIKLKESIESKFHDAEFSVPDLCKDVNLSHTQLYRKLKALTGKTPSQFVRTIRLGKAFKLLQDSDLNISEVAYEVGFSDPNYFSRMFKQEFGIVPGEVKKADI